MQVGGHSVDDAIRQANVFTGRDGLTQLCPVCRACPVVDICGGGLYAHRYRTGTGFDNPSVYCADLKEMIAALTTDISPREVPSPKPVHALSAGDFDALAAGAGNAAAISVLAPTQLSLTRALVAAVAEEGGWRDPELRQAAEEGWKLLCALDKGHPEAVAEIFSHPYVHAWAVRCLRPAAGADPDLDRAHFAGLAAAAALQPGVAVDLALPVRGGLLHLPSAGALVVDATTDRTVRLSIADGRLPSSIGVTWQPVRRVQKPDFQIAVEDLDPFRDCQDWPATGRLTGHEWQSWRSALEAARRLGRYRSRVCMRTRCGIARGRAAAPRPGYAQRHGALRVWRDRACSARPGGMRGFPAPARISAR